MGYVYINSRSKKLSQCIILHYLQDIELARLVLIIVSNIRQNLYQSAFVEILTDRSTSLTSDILRFNETHGRLFEYNL